MNSIAFLDEIQISVRRAQRSGVFHAAKGRCVLESRTSELGKGFKNPAPAWLAKRSSTAASSVLIRVLRG